MKTCIAIELEPEVFRSITLHAKEYTHTLDILQNFFGYKEKVLSLMDRGDLEEIHPSLYDCQKRGVPSRTIRGFKNLEVGRFNYIFTDGRWIFLKN